MAQRTITGTVKVQLSKYYGLDSLKGESNAVFRTLCIMDTDMSEHGYSVIGSAEVTVTLHDPDQIIGDKVKSLRAEAKKVQADAVNRCTEIERQVQQLLAITLDSGVTA